MVISPFGDVNWASTNYSPIELENFCFSKDGLSLDYPLTQMDMVFAVGSSPDMYTIDLELRAREVLQV